MPWLESAASYIGSKIRKAGERMELASADTRQLWPSTLDVARRNRYERGWMLYAGAHMALFEPRRNVKTHGPYVVANALRACSRAISDRMTLEPVRVEVSGREDAEEQIDAMFAASQAGRMFQRAIKGWSYRGDLVLKTYVQTDKLTGERSVIVGEIHPSEFFPTYHPEDAQCMTAVDIDWEIQHHDSNKLWQREEHHEPGTIENRLYILHRDDTTGRYYREQVALDASEMFSDVEEFIDTGIDRIPIVHAPNNETGEDMPWGESDYSGGAEELQRVLNERATDHRHILRKWADPMVGVGETYLNEQKQFNAYENKAIVMLPGEQKPEFISVPIENYPHSDAEADKALRRLLWHIGVSPESIGINEGNYAESGRALKLRQHDTLATVARKWVTLEPALKTILSISTDLAAAHTGGVEPVEAEDITIIRSMGLIEDEREELEVLTLKQGLGVSDEQLLREMYPDWTEEAIEEELARRKAAQPDFGLQAFGTVNAPPSIAERAQEMDEDLGEEVDEDDATV